MIIREYLIKSIGVGLCWGIGLAVFSSIMITSSLWWENTYNGIEKADIDLSPENLEKDSILNLIN